jgi:hypothetical protein
MTPIVDTSTTHTPLLATHLYSPHTSTFPLVSCNMYSHLVTSLPYCTDLRLQYRYMNYHIGNKNLKKKTCDPVHHAMTHRAVCKSGSATYTWHHTQAPLASQHF